MSKPSLIQTILNKPSQVYSFPQEKAYHSTKDTMLRVAAAAESSTAHRPHNTDASSTSSSSTTRRAPPSTSSRATTSRATTTTTAEHSRSTTTTTVKSKPTASGRPNAQPPSSFRRSQPLPDNFDDPSDDSDSDQDVWFTPRTSPRTSMASSVATIPFPSPRSTRSHPLPSPRNSATYQDRDRPSRFQPTTDLPSTSSLPTYSSASPPSTINSASVGGGHSSSVLSGPLSETSITPVQSDDGHGISTGPGTTTTRVTITKAKTTRPTPPKDPSATVVKATITRKPPISYSNGSAKRNTPLDAEKLSNHIEKAAPKRPTTPEIEEDLLNLPMEVISFMERGDPPPPPKPSRPRIYQSQDPGYDAPPQPRRGKKSASKAQHNIMVSMAALIEEDEETMSNRSRSVKSGIDGQYASNSGTRVLMTSSDEPTIIEEDRLHTPSEDLSIPFQIRHRRSRSLDYSSSERKYVPPTNMYEESTLPSHGTRGHTSLTLPRAPLTPSAALGLSPAYNGDGNALLDASGNIDLTKSGIAQTTMATIEVVRGLSHKSGKGWRAVRQLFAKHTTGGGEVELAFTSYRASPKHVPARSLLIQVWAVALDEVDLRLLGVGDGSLPEIEGRYGRRPSRRFHKGGMDDVRARLGKSAEVGYIPGRSFVGRVLECGWEISEESMRRGEWVSGLLDPRKNGGLAEFIVAERHRVHRVPHPDVGSNDSPSDGEGKSLHSPVGGQSDPHTPTRTSPYTTLSRTPSTSGASSTLRGSPARRPSMKSPPRPKLTLEELATLPLVAIPAYRAVRTFQFACASWTGKSGKTPVNSPSKAPVATQSKPSFRAVVLRGHDGVGAMAAQMLAKQGWRVSVHAPLPQVMDPDDSDRNLRESMKIIEDRVQRWGADEVIFDDGGYETENVVARRTGPVVRVLRRLTEDGDVFDAVLDTVGGKEIWEASERLLGVSRPTGRYGQFTTLVGDNPERPLPTAGDHFRAGVRNWRMASNRTRKGSLGRSASLSLPRNGTPQQHNQPVIPDGPKSKSKVAYAWVSLTQDVDWEGKDVGESLGVVLKMALEDQVRPYLGEPKQVGDAGDPRLARFEQAPEVMGDRSKWWFQHMQDGGSVTIKVVE